MKLSMCYKVFKLLSDVSRNCNVFYDVLRCIRCCKKLQGVIRCFEMLSDVKRSCQDVIRCFKMLSVLLRSCKVLQDVIIC